jgi:uncharacterized protein YggE
MRFVRLRRLAGAATLGALAALAPFVAARAADLPHVITVSGEGAAKAVPDQAELSAGVTTTAATAAAALAENAQKMTAVFDALKRMGVPEKAIQTSNFSVSPQYPPYNQNATEPQRIVGYQVSNQVDVTLDDTKKLGPALDALVSAGANQINSVGFSIRDAEALLAKARAAAITDAMTRAQTYAQAAGVTLGAVISIQEGATEAPRPMYRMAVAGAPAAHATPTAAGEQSVTANVSVVFEIK